MTPMLDIRGIRKTFNAHTANEVRALRGVDLAIDSGSFVVVIGTNGSGKSTLLNAVAGGFFVDSGSLHIDGTDVTAWPEHRRAAYIGRVFQDPFSGTATSMSIAENLALAARRGRPRGLGRALHRSALDGFRDRVRRLNMGLEDRLQNPIGSLSGGQRQALTTMMVTHSMSQAANLGDRLIMMHRGTVLHDIRGVEKQRLRANDLLNRFEDVRRADLLDESAAAMLRRLYV